MGGTVIKGIMEDKRYSLSAGNTSSIDSSEISAKRESSDDKKKKAYPWESPGMAKEGRI